jgi:hypothetical protein
MRCRRRFVVAGLLGFAAVATAEGPATRPADPWVFRSVLDKHPRMITVALHENLWLAFDAQSCTWRKAWKGGVKFTGSVYDTKHGPQPQSVGKTYFSNGPEDVLAHVQPEKVGVRPVYRGYRLDRDRLTLRYDVVTADVAVTVEDGPEYDPAKHEWVRRVRVGGLKENQSLDLPLPKEVTVSGGSVTGDAELTATENAGVIRFRRDGEAVVRLSLPNVEP